MRAVLLGLGLLLALLVFVAASTEAKVDGPCTATIAGADMAQVDEVSIQPGQEVAYQFAAPTPVSSYDLQIFYGPYAAKPSSGEVETEQTMISGSADMAKYAWLGVGVYELKGTVQLQDGSSCTGTIRVNVEGNPLTTAVGGTAAAVSAASTIGLILLFLKDAGWLFSAA